MKLVFFSFEHAEVEQVRQEFIQAGIPCEVHEGEPTEAEVARLEQELWIQNDGDSHKAKLLCVERRMGFAKLAPRPDDIEESGPKDGRRAVDYFD